MQLCFWISKKLLSHEFLNNVLSKFILGESFKNWKETMYKNTESCVINNGWLSKPFQINRGIRQGCPLSALLFLLVVEILAVQIRKHPEEGFNVKHNGENKFINITQLADDTTLFLKKMKKLF